MPRRILVFCALAAVAAAIFLRLGFWQIARLRERQAWNANFTRQQTTRPVDFRQLPRDSAEAHYRGVRISGRFDYGHELILSPRTRRGSPGVELLTPVRLDGTDTAVMVNRGWVYSPDASTVDQPRWREGDSASLLAYVQLYAADTAMVKAANPRVIRRVTRAELAARLPYPVAPYFLIAVGDTADLSHPARRELPALDEGPHREYAIQWFIFAAIAVVGAGIVAWRDRSRVTAVHPEMPRANLQQ